MTAQTIVSTALWLTFLGLITLGLYLLQEIQRQRSAPPPATSTRSPAPYRVNRPEWRSENTPFTTTLRSTSPLTPPKQAPAPRSTREEMELIRLLQGNREQAKRLIQSAGSADRALHQLLRDRQ